MKKYSFLAVLALASMVLTYCGPSKKSTGTTSTESSKPKTTYAANVSTIIMSDCVPCHIPAKGGNKRSYDNYANVKADIDEIIRRIELNPGDRGFMPFKHDKLPAEKIAVFKQFKADGMPEN